MDVVYGPGSTVSFRLPKNTPAAVSDYLNDLKKTNGRKFGSVASHLFVDAVSDRLDGEKFSIPLPNDLSEEQKQWLKDPTSKQMIGNLILYLLQGNSSPVMLEGTVPPQLPENQITPDYQISSYHSRLANSIFDDE